MKKLILALEVFAVLAIASGGAEAASWTNCNGDPIKWRGTLSIHRNRCSIPDTGIVNSAYWNGNGQWNTPADEIDEFLVRPASDCSWNTLDFQNEIALANRSELDGANGTTFSIVGPCVIGPNDIDQADVVIANDLNFSVRNGNFVGTSGRSTFVHEFGHFFGFHHENQNGIMRTSPPHIITGGPESASLWPTDASGMSQNYGFSIARPDLVVASMQPVGGSVTSLDPNTTVTVCRGASVPTSFYVGNIGNQVVSQFGFRYRLSTVAPPGAYFTGGTVVQTGLWNNFPSFGNVVFNFPFTVPSTLPNGTYFIYYDVDQSNLILERNDNNNSTVSAKRITVNC